MTTVGFASCLIPHYRFMKREMFLLWQSYLAASNLYVGMIGRPALFDENEIAAQHDLMRYAETAHNTLSREYERLYLIEGPEEN